MLYLNTVQTQYKQISNNKINVKTCMILGKTIIPLNTGKCHHRKNKRFWAIHLIFSEHNLFHLEQIQITRIKEFIIVDTFSPSYCTVKNKIINNRIFHRWILETG